MAVAIGAYNQLRGRSDAPEIRTTWSEDGTVWMARIDFAKRVILVTRKTGAYGPSPKMHQYPPITPEQFDKILI